MNVAADLARERRARLAAEHLLKLKQDELFAANEKLSRHALALSDEIVIKRKEVQQVQTKAEELEGQNVQVKQDLEHAHTVIDIAQRRLWDSIETIEDGFAVFDNTHKLIVANTAYLSVFDGLECVKPGISYFEILDIMTAEGIVDTRGKNACDWADHFKARWRKNQMDPEVLRLWNGQFVRLVDRRNEDGDTVSLALNITETIRTERILKDARQRAETANKAKSVFLAKMSHELRTPMNGVVGMTELLSETDLTEEQSLFVETIRSSGEALLDLINDVLDFSKIEASKLTLHPEEFDLERCIHEVTMLFQPAVQTRNLELVVDYDIFLPTEFVGDAGRIRQIFTNLVGNAVKFTSQGHVKISVVGAPADAKGDLNLHVSVKDTGMGISSDMLEHIFGEFNQVEDEKNRNFEGTGLGLAITRQLVDLMGGKIWVDSELGVGSNFGFSIPLQPAKSVDPMPLPSWLGHATLVGGNSAAAETLVKQLSGLGVTVARVQSPHELTSVKTDLLVCEHVAIDTAKTAMAGYNPSVPALCLVSDPTQKPDFGSRPMVALSRPYSRTALMSSITELGKTFEIDTHMPLMADQTKTERRMRILAAEDNKTNRLVFSKLVRSLNIDLEFAENGAEAVEKWRQFQPDLIFMDISMPQMDGKEATRNIRKKEAALNVGRTTIVALTAHNSEEDKSEILASGLDHFLTKPLRKAEIFDRIEKEIPMECQAVFEYSESDH